MPEPIKIVAYNGDAKDALRQIVDEVIATVCSKGIPKRGLLANIRNQPHFVFEVNLPKFDIGLLDSLITVRHNMFARLQSAEGKQMLFVEVFSEQLPNNGGTRISIWV